MNRWFELFIIAWLILLVNCLRAEPEARYMSVKSYTMNGTNSTTLTNVVAITNASLDLWSLIQMQNKMTSEHATTCSVTHVSGTNILETYSVVAPGSTNWIPTTTFWIPPNDILRVVVGYQTSINTNILKLILQSTVIQ